MSTEQGERFAPELKLRVLDWVLDEQLSGRAPTSVEVGARFGMTAQEAERLRQELERQGEL